MQTKIAATLLGTLLASGSLLGQNCFDLNLGTDLNLSDTDDSTVNGLNLGFTFPYAGVNYTQVCVCSNGYVWFGPTAVAGGDYTPTEAELLAGAPRVCPLWTDFNPGAVGSGHVYFNAIPASGGNPAYALVSWANVYEYGTTVPASMQLKLDANSNMFITLGNDTATLSGGSIATQVIIGASPGGGAASNLVSFAARPFASASDTLCEVIQVPAPPFPYPGVSMIWVPTTPGCNVATFPCTPNPFPSPASFTTIGRGCPTQPVIYELFANSNPTNPIDLSNLSYLFIPNGSGG